MTILNAFVYLPIFLLISFAVFYLVGFGFSARFNTKLKGGEVISVSTSLGIVLFVLLNLITEFLRLRFLTLPILLILVVLFFVKNYKKLIRPINELVGDRIFLAILVIGILVQGFISFPSGLLYKDGLLFWSSQAFDGFWHISLMEEIKQNFPPRVLLYSGENLQNYHYLVDVLMGEFGRIFPFFSSLDLYFRYFPIIFSFLIGVSVYSFVYMWRESKVVAYWAMFFTYFAGSFGFIVTFLKDGKILGGETVFWGSQLDTIIGNPPHAIAIGILCSALITFLTYLKERQIRWLVITFILTFMLVGFKVSGGVVFIVGVGISALFSLLFERKFYLLILFLLLGFSNAAVLKLLAPNPTSYLIFEPWWFIRNMIITKLGLIDWEHKRQHYLAKGTATAWIRLLHLEVMGFLIFVFGNLGMRFLGFLALMRIYKRKKEDLIMELMLVTILLVGFMVPMFFLQKGIASNSIQFIQYFLLIFGFYAALSVGIFMKLLKQKALQIVVSIAIIIFSLPTTVGNFVEFYGNEANAKVTRAELQALDFIKANVLYDEVVLTMPFNSASSYKYKKRPLPISAWYSTGYISSLTGKMTYLTCEDMVEQIGLDKNIRLDAAREFFEQKDFESNKKFLADNGIDYIYVPKDEFLESIDKYKLRSLDTSANGLQVVYENDEVVIYKKDF